MSEKSGDDCGSNAWWDERSLPVKILMGLGFAVLGVGFLALCGWVVMLLWNWLMPEIFGLKRLDFWQAWGILALSTILFKGFGSGGGDNRRNRKRKRELRRHMAGDEPASGKEKPEASGS